MEMVDLPLCSAHLLSSLQVRGAVFINRFYHGENVATSQLNNFQEHTSKRKEAEKKEICNVMVSDMKSGTGIEDACQGNVEARKKDRPKK